MSSTSVALLEIGTEELPARFAIDAVEQLKSLTEEKLKERRLAFASLETYGTPRRLTLKISGLEKEQPTLEKEVRGPSKAVAYDADGKPTQALLGFLKSQNATPNSVQIRDSAGKPYVFVNVVQKGKESIHVLAELLPEIIGKLSFPKQMRWNGEFAFGRAIRWILAMFEDKIIPFEIAALKSDTQTYGHRFLAPKPVRMAHVNDYQTQLEKAFVIVDPNLRMKKIKSQVEVLAREKSARAVGLDSLLPEVTWLVEYPTAFLGAFEARFLALPQEVLVTVMRHHQRYFPLLDEKSVLLPYFVAIRNGNDEGLNEVRGGNEQVLRARFKDAEYFFETDKKIKLLDRFEKLEKLVFQKNLGTISLKVQRLQELTQFLLAESGLEKSIPMKDLELVVKLCKCDLTTQMVFELPELQGQMGKEYATLEGYPKEIAEAIADHYLPRFQGDHFPITALGALLGIADRMDTLVGCFGLKAAPSGSSDPLGLRRAAATLLQIISNKNLSINLERLMDKTYELYFNQSGFFQSQSTTDLTKDDLLSPLRSFILERNEGLWKSEGIKYDMIRALSPIILKNPAQALKTAQFLENERAKQKEKFDSCVTAWVRVFNILKSKEAKALNTDIHEKPQSHIFKEAEEKTLWNSFEAIEPKLQNATGDIEKKWKLLSQFEAPIHQFFEKILVMAPEENLRNARLQLLFHVQGLMRQSFGDISQLV